MDTQTTDLQQPLVSCLCVTHKKPEMLKRIIICFYEQSYENKQLVIVYENFDILTREFLTAQTFDKRIKIVAIDSSIEKNPLGELRNISIHEADGEYVCQWDDDDWYDPDRLAIQMQYVRHTDKPACILSRWIMYDALSGKAYLSGRRPWEGSILCRKDLLVEYPYPAIHKGEDSHVIESLLQKDKLYIIDNMPELYIYVSHGNNTWEQEHFNRFFQSGTELLSDYSSDIRKILEESWKESKYVNVFLP